MTQRRRNLFVLGSAALISLLLAAFALKQRAAEGIPQYKPTEFLPGFAANVKNAALIQIVSHDGTFDIAYTPEKGWVLPGHGNYPADFDEVRHTLIGLAALETIAPKTSRADWLHYLSLDVPPKGGGIALTVKDAHGAVLASLIMGNMEELGDPGGSSGLFVRRPGENQAWLARAVFVPHGDVAPWLFTHVLDLGAARLEDVTVTPVKGPGFTLSRGHPSDQIYTLANAPKAGKPNALFINSIAYAVTAFSFTDVRPAASLDFTKPGRLAAHSFDGLLVRFELAQQDNDVWARLSAATAPGAPPAIVQEAQAINARTAGWAYKLPPEKAQAMQSDLAKVMTPAAPDMNGPGAGP